jgi:FHS family L-fucose permease-like MFS transporter
MIGRLLGTISMGKFSKRKKNISMALTSVLLFAFIYIITSLKKSQGVFHFEFIPLKEISIFVIFLLINYIGFVIGGKKSNNILGIFSIAIIVLLLMTVFGHGSIAFWSAIGIGLFNSIMWSNIFTLAIKDLGKYTGQGSSLLVMAVVGGAVIPRIQGWVIDNIGVQVSFLVPIVSYVYLAIYGFVGYKQKKEKV